MNLTHNQLIEIYSDLVKAYYCENHYGTNTAEIYAYRMRIDNPGRLPGFVDFKSVKEQNIETAKTLYEILLKFKEYFPSTIYIENRLLGKWIQNFEFEHRVHIKIIRKDKKK
jgi:hypothetical protein